MASPTCTDNIPRCIDSLSQNRTRDCRPQKSTVLPGLGFLLKNVADTQGVLERNGGLFYGKYQLLGVPTPLENL